VRAVRVGEQLREKKKKAPADQSLLKSKREFQLREQSVDRSMGWLTTLRCGMLSSSRASCGSAAIRSYGSRPCT